MDRADKHFGQAIDLAQFFMAAGDYAFFQFRCGLIGERENDDVCGLHPFLQQMGDTAGDHFRFARSRASDQLALSKARYAFNPSTTVQSFSFFSFIACCLPVPRFQVISGSWFGVDRNWTATCSAATIRCPPAAGPLGSLFSDSS